MRVSLGRLAGGIVSLRPGEGATAALMFAYSFLAMTAYNVLRPITRSQAISALGADNLPYVQLAAGLAIGVLMHAYTRVTSGWPRRVVIPASQAGEALLLLAFWALFLTGAAWVSVAFYVLGLLLGVLLISQFWTLANDIYDARQARRLFGFIGGGASLGGATGAGLTVLVVERVGTNNLLLVSAALLLACAALVAFVARRHAAAEGECHAAEPVVRGRDAFALLRESRHLRVIALAIASAAIGAAIIDQQLNMAAASISGAAATDTITGFLAQVTLYVSVIGLVIQVGLTSRIHRHLGLGAALLMLPLALGATAAVILVTGAIWAVAAARVVDASLRYTVDKTSREVLFLPLSSSVKYLAKPFVDVTVDRVAKALGALCVLVLIKPWGAGLDWRQLSYASLAVTGVWIGVALVARREYLRSFRRGLGDRTIAASAVRLDVADAGAIEALVEQLASADEEAVLYAIDLLDHLGKRHLVTPLLLHHESARVRARTLRAWDVTRGGIDPRRVRLVERMLRDPDADVRAAAVGTLAAIDQGAAADVMRAYVDDPEPRVAATAAGVLAASGSASDLDLADRTFHRLVGDTRPAAAAARREAAAALGRMGPHGLRTLLVPLLLDPEPEVAREAIRSVQASGDDTPVFLPALVSLLGHRVLKREARQALLARGAAIVEPLAFLLADRDEQPWVRRHIPGTLAHLPVPGAMPALVAHLGDPDGFLRYKVIDAVERLHRIDPGLAFDRAVVERVLLQETGRYHATLALRDDLVTHRPDVAGTLLVQALDEKLVRTIDRVFRLLGLIHPWQDIAAARYTIEHAAGRARAGALEYLDSLLSGPLRKRVMAMLEEGDGRERARRSRAVLGTRPRSFDDVMAQLVHDTDPAVAAAAVLVAGRCEGEALRSDLELLATHALVPTDVAEAAGWVLQGGRLPDADAAASTVVLPAAKVVDRLRTLPLFAFVSVDELFRVTGHGQRRTHPAGTRLCRAGTAVDPIRFVLSGRVRQDGRTEVSVAPLTIGAEEAVTGRPAGESVEAVTPVACLELDTPTCLALLAESAPLAQGIFRTLLHEADDEVWRRLSYAPAPDPERVPDGDLQPVHAMLLLREHPLLGGATADQLLDLAAVMTTVAAAPGEVLARESDPPALLHVVRGEVRLEWTRTRRAAALVPAGHTVGLPRVLTGCDDGLRATATAFTWVLRASGTELFRLLADRADLLQCVLAAVHRARYPSGESFGDVQVARSAVPGIGL